MQAGRLGAEPAALDGPHAQLLRTLDAVQTARFADEDVSTSAQTIGHHAITGNDRAWLQSEFRRLVEAGAPPQVAASYLAGWYAGSVAEFVGLALASEGAAITIDAHNLRWRVHERGWVVGIDAEFTVTVAEDHRWAGRSDVVVVADERAMIDRAVTNLVDTVAPIVEACRSLTRVGLVGLWNEVGDALGMVLCHQTVIDADDTKVALLSAAVATVGVPWRASPTLWFIDREPLGHVHVAQKGGCCLAYTEPDIDDSPQPGEFAGEQSADGLVDEYHTAYGEGFPIEAPGSRYCSTCSFRSPDDCAARQVFWHEFHRRASVAAERVEADPPERRR